MTIILKNTKSDEEFAFKSKNKAAKFLHVRPERIKNNALVKSYIVHEKKIKDKAKIVDCLNRIQKRGGISALPFNDPLLQELRSLYGIVSNNNFVFNYYCPDKDFYISNLSDLRSYLHVRAFRKDFAKLGYHIIDKRILYKDLPVGTKYLQGDKIWTK
ncbi:hypothetical protein [Lactobacillus mulieris]|uniref:Uncharacterized protein n=1 Tax=Lactobacillus mulieris TaxID=2508708 RepID=A0AAP3M2M1_9LACO|nr:hypothetical protein [Lactobacillus mulieris]MCZ3844130.1 hypothetical protein [Lactobacillus mulieris]MCZ3875790.1 hypothetical protein [Lactobacillus mulieris]WEB30174.1 hypothetical protein PUW59_05330 [Lactobacillus mulieris]